MSDAATAGEAQAWTAERFGDPEAPALVVVVHGGNWRASVNSDGTRPLAAALAGAGHHAWNLEYPRAGMPGGGWPGTATAVRDALDAALEEAAGRPVVTVGHSAGGHLALWAARGSELAGVVSLAGVGDLAAAAATDMRDDVAALLGGDPDTRTVEVADASPIARLPLGVPVIAIHGSADPLVPLAQSRAFVAAARAAGDDAELVELPGADHAQLRDPESAAWPTVRDCVARLARPGA